MRSFRFLAAVQELNTYPSTWPLTVTDDPVAEAGKVIEKVRTGSGVELSVEDVLTEKVLGLRERLGISCVLFGDIDALAPVVEPLAGG